MTARLLAVDPGLEVTGVALFEMPTPRLGTPMLSYTKHYLWADSLRSSKLADGPDEARMRHLAHEVVRAAGSWLADVVVVEIPARDNVYAAVQKRQRAKGSTMNLAEVMRNVRCGGALAGAVMTMDRLYREVHFFRADELAKEKRTALLAHCQYPDGAKPPANEHERDAVWLGLRWLADRAVKTLEKSP